MNLSLVAPHPAFANAPIRKCICKSTLAILCVQEKPDGTHKVHSLVDLQISAFSESEALRYNYVDTKDLGTG